LRVVCVHLWFWAGLGWAALIVFTLVTYSSFLDAKGYGMMNRISTWWYGYEDLWGGLKDGDEKRGICMYGYWDERCGGEEVLGWWMKGLNISFS
jgi:hypothetical protein